MKKEKRWVKDSKKKGGNFNRQRFSKGGKGRRTCPGRGITSKPRQS